MHFTVADVYAMEFNSVIVSLYDVLHCCYCTNNFYV